MKLFFLAVLIGCVASGSAQDTLQQMKQADSLVSAINHSSLYATFYDSTVQDFPDLKLYMKTYLTMVTQGKELIKYVNKVHSRSEKDGTPQTLNASSAFYYQSGQLQKVEEYFDTGSREQRIEWYFADGKPLRFIAIPAMTEKETAKLKERETTLILMAETLRKSVEKKLSNL